MVHCIKMFQKLANVPAIALLWAGPQHLQLCHQGLSVSLCICCRLGHTTRHFNVGLYRRKQKGEEEVQDATFFDHTNQVPACMQAQRCVFAFLPPEARRSQGAGSHSR